MKIIGKIKNTITNIRSSIKRFPITIGVSAILVLLLIYSNETRNIMSLENRETLGRLNMIVGLGIPLSLCIGLLRERFYKNEKAKEILGYLIGITLLVFYYFFLLKNFNMVSISRYLGTMLFLILAFFYIPWLRKKGSYENYVIKVFSNFFLTAIYSLILFLGITAIIFTIDTLFEVNIQEKIYFYMFLIVSLIFAVSLFLSKLPSVDEDFREYNYPKSLKILLIYIVIPLITVYTAILYAYFAKILITRVWPKGLVSHLVLWYSVLSVGITFLITPVLEESRVCKLFRVWFPKLILPILLMMFVSIGIRVKEYGITENRYYIIALGLWVLGIMMYFSIKKTSKNIIVPITLSVIILNSVFGPLSSFSISKISQNKRFENLILRNKMLINGEIVKNADITMEDKQEIINIINYFCSNHSLNNIKYLPKNFKTSDMENLMGFAYSLPYNHMGENHFNYNLNLWQEPISIKGYDYYISTTSWNEDVKTVDGIDLKYDRANHVLNLIEGKRTLLSKSIIECIEKINRSNIDQDNMGKGYLTKVEDMTFEDENENIKIKIIFTHISGRIDNYDGKIVLEEAEFILLVHKK